MDGTKEQCPEFPYFGANYPDARCIEGYLWDLDKCDEQGNLYGEGDIPCPFCNTDEFIEYDSFDVVDHFLIHNAGIGDPTPEQEKNAKEMARTWYLTWIEKIRKEYGKNKG